jgi:beta-glucosidase
VAEDLKYRELIEKMLLEEKASLLSGGGQFYTKTVERLGIPSMYLSDGPHGLRKQAGESDHLGLNASLPATCFPTAVTAAGSWDTALAEEIGRALGEEAKAQGVEVLLGPGLNIKRSPLCGRNFEYFSEDPLLAGKMAAAYIRGIQSAGVAACPKHYAANSQELLRMHSDSILDARTLREIYLEGFRIAVREGRPLAIMSSYNRVNGTYASESRELLRDILVDQWGFEGIVVTDWGGSNDRAAGVAAGGHLEMPSSGGDSDRELVQAVREGRLEEAVLDLMVDEYLRVLFALKGGPGLQAEEGAQAPLSSSSGEASGAAKPAGIDVEAHHAVARKAAQAGIVLLKNDGILPLAPGAKIAVIGDFAETPRYQGAGSSVVNPFRVESPLERLEAAGLHLKGYTKGMLRHGGEDPALLREAAETARGADLVLLWLGLDEVSETEGMDRRHLRMNANQGELLEAVAAVNPNIVVVLAGGSPVEIPWLDKCRALIHGLLGGQAGAGAMADALTGKVNPSGRLAETWPLSLADTPCAAYYPGTEQTAEYREGVYVGYRYYATAGVPVRFPFGFGLSYTTFEYSGLEASLADSAPEGKAGEITFTLKNSGGMAGAETVQVYAEKKDGAVFRPLRVLAGFAKVFLRPGEERRVAIPLGENAFRFYNPQSRRYETEGGAYTLAVGASAEDIRLRTEVSVAGDAGPLPWNRAALPHYWSADVKAVPAAEFQALLGRPVPETKWNRAAPLDLNDTFTQLEYAKSPLGRIAFSVLSGMKAKAEARGHPDLNILYIFNMPFRGMAKMTGGAVNMEMARALVDLVNGHFFRGFGGLIGAAVRGAGAAKKTAKILGSPPARRESGFPKTTSTPKAGTPGR